MSILQEIVRHKQKEVARSMQSVPPSELHKRNRSYPSLDFPRALSRKKFSIIAEVKRKSPSAGDINPGADPLKIAQEYQANGASAISVLTDEKYFGGSLEFLREIKQNVKIPVLRKDFILSEYQVQESHVAGADAVLLIADVLDAPSLKNLYNQSISLGMSVIVEVYSADHLPSVLEMNPPVIGVNARNLSTMKTNLHHLQEMISLLPEKSLKVAESGIETAEDLKFIFSIGYDAALIGTAFMGSNSPGKTLKNFLGSLNE